MKKGILYTMMALAMVLVLIIAFAAPVAASDVGLAKSEVEGPLQADAYYLGETIYYELEVYNRATNPPTNTLTRLWDTLPDGTVIEFLGPGETLVQAPGDSELYYCQYVVSEADLEWIIPANALSDPYWGVKNTFEVQGYDSLDDDVYGLTTKTSRILRPELSIEKLVDFDADGIFTDSETYYAGEPAEWAIVVTNTGFDPVYDIYVSDDNEGVDFHGPFDLLPGESEIVPVYTTYPTEDTMNTACAVGEDLLGNPVGPECDPAEVFVIDPAISIEKTVDFDADGIFTDSETYYAGEPAEWAIVVTNIGVGPVYNIYVSDDNLGVDFHGPFDLLANGDFEIIPIYTTYPMVDTINLACAEGVDELGNPVGPECDPA